MTTVTDVLETVFKITGATNLTASLNQAASGMSRVAAAQNRMTAAQSQAAAGAGSLSSALGGLVSAQNLVAVSLGGALVAGLKNALSTFAEDEQAIFRTTVVLRNLGNSFPIERAQALGSSLQKLTGVDDEAVVSLIGLEKRFGIADDQIEGTTKTILDFAKGTGLSLEQAGDVVGRALLGQTRGLRALGIEFTASGNKAKDLITIQEKLNGLFGGAAEANRHTLAGTLDATKESLNNLLSVVGEKLAVVVIPILDKLIVFIDFLTKNVGLLIGVLEFLPSRPNAAASIGNGKSRLATEDTLQEVADNTKGMNDALIKAVLGGSLSTFARGGANARDFQLAFRA